MGKNIAIYSRKSKFTGKGESIENQIELCKQYAQQNYQLEAPLNFFLYEDEGFSGKNTSRPRLRQMLKDAREGKFSVLICYRLDRISRNVGDFANMIEDLIKFDIDFISINEKFDTSTSMGRAMMYIASVFAQLERETIAERIRDNMYELSKTGRWLGGTTPTGYTSESINHVAIDQKVRKSCKLKLLPEEARTVRIIFDKFLECGSLTKTDAYLVQNNYTTKNHLNFTRHSIKNILTNLVYLIADEEAYGYLMDNKMDLFAEKNEFDGKHGIMAYNRTLQKDGKTNQPRDKSEWIIAVGKHEGLVSGRKWIRVQELLESNKSKAYKKPRTNVALVSGLLFCGNCGGYMRPKLTRGETTQGERAFYYLCSMKEKSNCKCCNMKNPNGNLIDQEIMGAVVRLSEDQTVFTKRMDSLKKLIHDNNNVDHTELDRLKRKINENEKEISVLVKTLTKVSESPTHQYVLRQIEQNHKNIENLKSQLATLLEVQSDPWYLQQDLSMLTNQIISWKECFRKATIEWKRIAVRSMIDRIVWDGENLHLYYKEE